MQAQISWDCGSRRKEVVFTFDRRATGPLLKITCQGHLSTSPCNTIFHFFQDLRSDRLTAQHYMRLLILKKGTFAVAQTNRFAQLLSYYGERHETHQDVSRFHIFCSSV